jgi:hypothetical protein
MRASPKVHELSNNNEMIGYCLEADFVAEHKWGIKDIYREFGVDIDDKSRIGLDRRKITEVSDKLFYFSGEARKEDYLVFNTGIYDQSLTYEKCKNRFTREVYIRDNGLGAAWSGDGFIIAGRKKENKSNLKKLYSAFLGKDIIIYIGGNTNPSSRGGLVIASASKFPDDLAKQMLEVDISQDRLETVVNNMGIEERLKNSGKRYYCLSPSWKSGIDSEVRFWLNPMERDKNNYGWFTLKDLEDWAEHKGVIPKEIK